MLGKATVEVDTFALTHSSSSKVTDILATKTDGDTQTFAEKERDLLSADEVRRLNREWMLMFVQGCPPIIAKRITYFKDSNFKDYASDNPYITGVNPFKSNLAIQ
ncbi:MAG: type IV secretory system conjugative DNA transfer family protein [Victivallales bacterium]|nr:type IV secretory system conjugative DNA transfer family protein [Victivallales bacterium]